MDIVELEDEDAGSAAALWAETGLIRPWNDPEQDFRRAIAGPTSAVLGVKSEGELLGTVMVGSDGHRGWVYYLSVGNAHRRVGLGSQLMKSAEAWLITKGVVKVQLMVRSDNESANGFYEHIGYEENDVRVLSRWVHQ
jgi:ribosomal protein S18 acetylase RimI-like enzyme